MALRLEINKINKMMPKHNILFHFPSLPHCFQMKLESRLLIWYQATNSIKLKQNSCYIWILVQSVLMFIKSSGISVIDVIWSLRIQRAIAINAGILSQNFKNIHLIYRADQFIIKEHKL
jgi:hypothetical protein